MVLSCDFQQATHLRNLSEKWANFLVAGSNDGLMVHVPFLCWLLMGEFTNENRHNNHQQEDDKEVHVVTPTVAESRRLEVRDFRVTG